MQVEALLADDANLPSEGRPVTLTFHRKVRTAVAPPLPAVAEAAAGEGEAAVASS